MLSAECLTSGCRRLCHLVFEAGRPERCRVVLWIRQLESL